MQGLLDGKRVVVNGASRGLGRSFATAMAAGSFFLFDTVLRVPLPRGPFGF